MTNCFSGSLQRTLHFLFGNFVWWFDCFVENKYYYFGSHVASICASCFVHIRAFWHIRPNLTQDMAKSVAVSLISSGLDYCNSLLFGSSQANIHKLQRVQNVIAKLVCASIARSSDALWSLHWLPIIVWLLLYILMILKWNRGNIWGFKIFISLSRQFLTFHLRVTQLF